MLFRCGKIATKAVPEAAERIKGLKRLGFAAAEEKVIGHDGTPVSYTHLDVYKRQA